MSEKRHTSAPCRTLAVALLAAFCAATLPAAAGSGGNVLPSSANPKGYSLVDAARATAVFNTGDLSATPPNLPFYTLTDDATLKPGTSLYIPIFFADDSAPVDPNFPDDVTDQDAAADYLLDLISDLADVDAFLISVDGNVTVLDPSYIAGTTTPPLQDGTPAGTNYIVSAAYLTPLTPGKHTIGIGGLIDGHPAIIRSYDVTVTNK
jgi:hypothetical protein